MSLKLSSAKSLYDTTHCYVMYGQHSHTIFIIRHVFRFYSLNELCHNQFPHTIYFIELRCLCPFSYQSIRSQMFSIVFKWFSFLPSSQTAYFITTMRSTINLFWFLTFSVSFLNVLPISFEWNKQLFLTLALSLCKLLEIPIPIQGNYIHFVCVECTWQMMCCISS